MLIVQDGRDGGMDWGHGGSWEGGRAVDGRADEEDLTGEIYKDIDPVKR